MQVGFVVLAKDNDGESIKSSFFPFYGSSEKQKYNPEPDENARTYKDIFVPYTVISLNDSTAPSFLPGYPRIEGVHAGGFVISAHLVKAAAVQFLVTPSDDFFLFDGSWAVSLTSKNFTPGHVPADFTSSWTGNLDQVGLLPFDPVSAQVSDTKMWYNLTGLSDGGNYTVVMATKSTNGESAESLVAIGGIMTPDVNPPTFENITLLSSNTDEASGTFSLRLSVRLDEPSTVLFAAYTNQSCVTGNYPSNLITLNYQPQSPFMFDSCLRTDIDCQGSSKWNLQCPCSLPKELPLLLRFSGFIL